MEKFFNRIFALCVFVVVLTLSSCSKHHSDEPDPEPEPDVPAGEAVRTVLVYMIAANNLNIYASADIDEMRQAVSNGDNGNGNLLIYKVTYNQPPALLKVTKTGLETLKEYDDGIESLTIAQMRTVLQDARQLAPAQDYGLVLWGHASGWFENGIEEDEEGLSRVYHPMLYSYGCDQSNGEKVWMNSASLGEALRGQELSFVYFDCCFMGGVEVLYELRGVAPYIAASPTEIKGDGMPYQLNIRVFFEKDVDLVEAAQNYYDYYEDIYQNGKDDGCPYAIAVYDMAYIDDLADATRRIYETSSIMVPVGYSVQQFGVSMNGYQNCYYDFEDYVTSLLGKTHPLVEDWKNIMDKVIVYKATSRSIWGTPIDKYCGLSTYMIKSGADPNLTNQRGYEKLGWYADVASAIIK